MSAELLLAAFGVDLLVGDPRWLVHPTQVIGWVISRMESLFRRIAHSPLAERIAGTTLVALVVLGSWTATYWILRLSGNLSPVLSNGLGIWFLATTIAARGLAGAGGEVYSHLMNGNLGQARQSLGYIVGRDTEKLPVPEVVRGAVETVAENTVDGIVSPVFYAVLGGVPLAMAYRAVNTLDSMLGYRNERYRYFGWAAARLDDLANYLPARITGLLMLAVIGIMGMDIRGACKIWRRDAKKHPSPNSGIPESVTAGGLGVRLGGINSYHGQASFRAHMGEDRKPLEPSHIKDTIRIMYATAILVCLIGAAILAKGR
ncbi:cobalamin biosynthesis protein [Clostridiales bacterium PH28_bin88]|nr:cobalamin biosynthesis protein [Clostridiales bacterium PH28_bin88]